MNVTLPVPIPGRPLAQESEVVHIRLWHAACGWALLSEFQRADSVLAGWAGRSGGDAVVFEVSFDDGLVLQGAHAFFRKGRRRCRFGAHVQRLLHDLERPDPAVPASPPQALTRCFLRS